MILRTVVIIVGMFVLIIFAWMIGVFVEPFMNLAMDSEAAANWGVVDHLETAMFIGAGLILPLLGFAVLIWAHIGEMRHDIGRRRM